MKYFKITLVVVVGLLLYDTFRYKIKLMRTSTVLGGWIHVATFDTNNRAEYNRDNCKIAAELFEAQPGVVVKYECM